jgi:hypothetical protein
VVERGQRRGADQSLIHNRGIVDRESEVRMWDRNKTRFIRIVRLPPGEAPLWVREKWVGLDLPLADGDRGPRHAFTSGVLSGPRNRLIAAWWSLRGRLKWQSGYAVNAQEALRRLETIAPDAASWWRGNVPRVLHETGRFCSTSPSVKYSSGPRRKGDVGWAELRARALLSVRSRPLSHIVCSCSPMKARPSSTFGLPSSRRTAG